MHLEITVIQGIIILSLFLIDINMTGNFQTIPVVQLFTQEEFFKIDFSNTLLNFNVSVRLIFMHFYMLY
jgi:hypothetical protein